MALTPQNLIADAELLAYPYADETTVAPGVLLRVLTQLDKEVADIFALAAPERLSTAGTPIAITTAGLTAGWALTAGKVYTDLKYIDRAGGVWPITLINEHEMDTARVHPAGIIRGSTFFPADSMGRRWVDGPAGREFWSADGDYLAYRYIAEPARVTTITQTLVSPDEAQPYLQWALVLTILLGTKCPETVLGNAATQRQLARRQVELMAAKRAGT